MLWRFIVLGLMSLTMLVRGDDIMPIKPDVIPFQPSIDPPIMEKHINFTIEKFISELHKEHNHHRKYDQVSSPPLKRLLHQIKKGDYDDDNFGAIFDGFTIGNRKDIDNDNNNDNNNGFNVLGVGHTISYRNININLNFNLDPDK